MSLRARHLILGNSGRRLRFERTLGYILVNCALAKLAAALTRANDLTVALRDHHSDIRAPGRHFKRRLSLVLSLPPDG